MRRDLVAAMRAFRSLWGGPNTVHSGTKPRPEVERAMIEISETFVQMGELLIAAGREIAGVVGIPAATVTSGASGGWCCNWQRR